MDDGGLAWLSLPAGAGFLLAAVVLMGLMLIEHSVEMAALKRTRPLAYVADANTIFFTLMEVIGAVGWLFLVRSGRPLPVGGCSCRLLRRLMPGGEVPTDACFGCDNGLVAVIDRRLGFSAMLASTVASGKIVARGTPRRARVAARALPLLMFSLLVLCAGAGCSGASTSARERTGDASARSSLSEAIPFRRSRGRATRRVRRFGTFDTFHSERRTQNPTHDPAVAP